MVNIKEPRRVFVVDSSGHCRDPPFDLHEIVRLDVKHGDTYAIDLSGAQYGFVHTIVPYAEFMKTQAIRVRSYHEFGSTTDILRDEYHTVDDPELGHRLWIYNVRFTNDMNTSMAHWQKHPNNPTLSALLSCPRMLSRRSGLSSWNMF